MKTRRAARGGRGSNQYQSRGEAAPRVSTSDLRFAVEEDVSDSVDEEAEEVAWAFSPDSELWRAAGVATKRDADRLVQAGLTPDDYRRWFQESRHHSVEPMSVDEIVEWSAVVDEQRDDAGLRDPDDAYRWHVAGFAAVEASEWAARGFDRKAARRGADSGASPQMLLDAWSSVGMSDPGDLNEWVAEGLTPRLAEKWRTAWGIVRPVHVVLYEANGIGVDEGVDWSDGFFPSFLSTPTQLLKWREGGFTPKDAFGWHAAADDYRKATGGLSPVGPSGAYDGAEEVAWAQEQQNAGYTYSDMQDRHRERSAPSGPSRRTGWKEALDASDWSDDLVFRFSDVARTDVIDRLVEGGCPAATVERWLQARHETWTDYPQIAASKYDQGFVAWLDAGWSDVDQARHWRDTTAHLYAKKDRQWPRRLASMARAGMTAEEAAADIEHGQRSPYTAGVKPTNDPEIPHTLENLHLITLSGTGPELAVTYHNHDNLPLDRDTHKAFGTGVCRCADFVESVHLVSQVTGTTPTEAALLWEIHCIDSADQDPPPAHQARKDSYPSRFLCDRPLIDGGSIRGALANRDDPDHIDELWTFDTWTAIPAT